MNNLRQLLAMVLLVTHVTAGAVRRTPGYSSIAACETILSDLNQTTTGATDLDVRVGATLSRVADLAHKDSSASSEELVEIVGKLADRPNFRGPGGFTLTNVYEGTSEINEYLGKTEADATHLENEATRLAEAKVFTRETSRKSVATLLKLSGAIATSNVVAIVASFWVQSYDPTNSAALFAVAGGISAVGSLTSAVLLGRHAEWAIRLLRAKADPTRRRLIINQIRNLTHVDLGAMRTWLTIQDAADLTRQKSPEPTPVNLSLNWESYGIAYRVPRTHAERMTNPSTEGLAAYLSANLASLRSAQVPTWILPYPEESQNLDNRSVRIEFTALLIRDPETREAHLIVQARGTYEPAP